MDVPDPFDLTDFSWRLLLDFHSDDPQAKENAAVSMMEGQDPILECCKFLREEECLVVIDGLRSTQDWDLIKATFLSEPTKGTIVVITKEAEVAVHCEGDPDSWPGVHRAWHKVPNVPDVIEVWLNRQSIFYKK